ncbi:uncharacterized protein LOC124997940 [Mugil cephalus]|uniref:uncharacterized protein LOC124997940 n=1 Tax=Mugil cephalus TaxID=48193 RepID=UPI001FB6412A|nr:uncharacterized protein LOC124997940 [Mugil cephalus]
MSDLPVNDHLEGILSDFEALKRSFDAEDVDDIPSFSPASPVSTPISPSSCHYFLNKAGEEQGGGSQSPTFAFNNNNNSLGSAAHSHSRLSSNVLPALKSRPVLGSLSFNRGSINKPVIHNNGSSVTRAASFQSRLNPNNCSVLSGPGSDYDSLHSSTSSLECSVGGVYTLPLAKPKSYHSPQPQGEYHGTQPQLPQHNQEAKLKKFSSHGSVFNSEINQKQGMMGVREPRGVNHGSMSILDFQSPDERVGISSMQRGGSEGRMAPGVKYVDANANWNGHLNNASSFGEVGYSKTHCQEQGPRILKSPQPQPKAKETPRLNKFPLDLDNLVSSTSTTFPTEARGGSMKPTPPKPPPRSSGSLHHHIGPPSSAASPSASLSSLDSSSDTPSHPYPQSFVQYSRSSPTHSQGSISISDMRCSVVPLSPSQNVQLDILPGPQVVQVGPSLPSPSSSSSASSPRAVGSLEEGIGDARDSVSLILQRIASFSSPGVADSNPASVAQYPTVQSNGGLSDHAQTTPRPARRQEKKQQEETARELETDLFTPMEERGEKEGGVIRQEKEDDGKSDGQRSAQTPVAEKEGDSVEIYKELGENEKGMETEEMKKEMELEAEVKMELCPPVPGTQMSYIRGTDLLGYVGIEAVLDQMRRKTMKAGFEFNIMVVGQSGLGKSTLVNTLFKSKISPKSCTPNYEEKISKTVKLHSVSHVIEEKGVKMKLTVTDTPGFGDQINNENCWEPIVKYVNEQYEKYLREELHVNRKRRIPDSRVHCCIYFLPATGHRLRPIDVEFMKRLGKIVSIVPVIAKADTLTIEERQEFKERIRQDLAANGIRVYPQKEYDEDPEERILNDRIRESIPFAVVGTDKEHQVNGNKVLGRKTKWGIIEVENVAHCEFAHLRDLLIRSHLQDLKDVTHNIHYETYRVRRLNESNINFSELGPSTWPLENGTDKCDSESQL